MLIEAFALPIILEIFRNKTPNFQMKLKQCKNTMALRINCLYLNEIPFSMQISGSRNNFESVKIYYTNLKRIAPNLLHKKSDFDYPLDDKLLNFIQRLSRNLPCGLFTPTGNELSQIRIAD